MNRFSVLIALVAFVGLASGFHHKSGLKHPGHRHHHHPQHFQSEGEDFGEVDSQFGNRYQGYEDEEYGLGHSLRNGYDVEGFTRNSGAGLGHRHGYAGHSGDLIGLPHGHNGFGGHRHGGKLSHGKRQSGLGRRGGLNNGINRHGFESTGLNGGNRHGSGDFESTGLGSGSNRHGFESTGLGGGANRHGSQGFEQGRIGGGNRFGGHRGRHGSNGGLNNGQGSSGINGENRRHKGFEAGLGGSNHGESRLGLEGHQGASISGEGHFNSGTNRGENDDIEGVRKHQVINKEKTTVKDRTNGVNDVDAFRHSTGSHDDRHSEIGGSASASENIGASLNSQKEFDNEFGAGLATDSSGESAGSN